MCIIEIRVCLVNLTPPLKYDDIDSIKTKKSHHIVCTKKIPPKFFFLTNLLFNLLFNKNKYNKYFCII